MGSVEELPATPLARSQISPDQGASWWRRLAPLVVTSRRRVVVALAFAVVAMAAQVALPRLVMAAVDQAIATSRQPLWPYVVALGAIAVVRGVATNRYRLGLQRVAFRLERDLRVAIHAHLGTLSHSFFDRVQSGQIISRANADIRSIQLYGAFAPIMAVQLITVVGALVVMLAIDPWLTAVSVLALPGVYLAAQRLRDQIFPLSWLVQARQADVATVVDENVNGARVVRAFAAEQRQISTFARAAERLRWITVIQNDARARWNPLIEALPRLSLALVLVVGGWRAVEGEVTVGALLAFSQYVVLLAAPFRFVGFVLMLGQRARSSAGRIFELLDERPAVVEAADAAELVDPCGHLHLDGVWFAYPAAEDEPVLCDLHLEVPAGQTVAVVGRSGSGKSTIGRLLVRAYDVNAGSVRVDGHDVRDLTLDSLRRHVSVVPDDPFLFSASIADNVAYAHPEVATDQIVGAGRDAAVDDVTAGLPDGYDAVIGERGHDLSGGQRQRIALARGLLGDPPVLVLDDATSSVDVTTEERIHERLRERRAGRTTVVVAHRLSTIALADRVVMLDGGRIVADGTHDELLATVTAYAELLSDLTDDDAAGGRGQRRGQRAPAW